MSSWRPHLDARVRRARVRLGRGRLGRRQAGPRDDGRHRRPTPPRPALLTVPVSLRGASVRPRRHGGPRPVAGPGLWRGCVRGAAGAGRGRRHGRSRCRRPPRRRGAATGLPSGLLARSVPAAFAPVGGWSGRGRWRSGRWCAVRRVRARGRWAATGATATGVSSCTWWARSSGPGWCGWPSAPACSMRSAPPEARAGSRPAQLNLARSSRTASRSTCPGRVRRCRRGGVPGDRRRRSSGRSGPRAVAGAERRCRSGGAVPVDLNAADAGHPRHAAGRGPGAGATHPRLADRARAVLVCRRAGRGQRDRRQAPRPDRAEGARVTIPRDDPASSPAGPAGPADDARVAGSLTRASPKTPARRTPASPRLSRAASTPGCSCRLWSPGPVRRWDCPGHPRPCWPRPAA